MIYILIRMIQNGRGLELKRAEYREENFFYNYKELQKKFDINGEKIIRDFIESHKYKGNIRIYNSLKKFRQNFTVENTYEFLSLEVDDQLEFINEMLSKREKEIIHFEDYNNIEKFDIYNFLERVDEILQENDPTIYVYVGNINYNYDYIHPKIKTEMYKNMIEGIIIKYQKNIYDYSI